MKITYAETSPVKFFDRYIKFINGDMPRTVIKTLSKVTGCEDATHTLVVTSEDRVHGALNILLPETIKRLRIMRITDFYVIPSSIHEVLVMPNTDYVDENELLSIVNDINNTEVDNEDILGYSLLHYNNGKWEEVKNNES